MPAFSGVPLEDEEQRQPARRAPGGRFGGQPLEEDPNAVPNQIDYSELQQAPTNVRQPGYGPRDVATGLVNEVTGAVKGAAGTVSDWATGNNRREFDLPEFDLPFEFSKRQAKTGLGLMSTFDPKRELSVLRENYPNLKFGTDAFENIIVDGSAYGGKVGYLNNPGISPRDLLEVGFQVAAFTPAGRAGQLATTTGKRMLGVGAAAAGTEAGMDLINQATGGTDQASLGNINKSNMAVAGVGGAAFEGIGIMLAKALLPRWQHSGGQITDEIRQVFYEEARKAGHSIEEVTDDVIQYYMDAAKSAVAPSDMPALRDTSEFGIRYTKGQATGDLHQLRLEERLRTGPSEGASNTMNRFREAQGEQTMAARSRLQGELGGPHPAITQPADAGEAIIEGVRQRSTQALQQVDEAYGDVGQASLLPQGQRGLVTRLERTIKSNQFITDPKLAPATAEMMGDISAFREFIDERGNLLTPQPMRHLERIRRRLNKYINSATTKEDTRQLTILKREFDTYLDRAVDNALFSGDETVIAQLKKARGLHAEYMRKFSPQYKRGRSGAKYKIGAGDIMERIIVADPTAEQAINFMFGLSKLGGKERGAQVAKQLREVLGPDSDEWSAIRQAAFLKLTDPGKAEVISGAKFLTNLTDAQNRAGTMVKTLFNEEEVRTLNRFARAVSRAQPELFNKSGTAASAAGYIADLWRNIVTMFGATQAGPAGAVAASAGTKTFSGLRAMLQARSATKPAQAPLRRLNLGAAGAPATVGAVGE